jgi:hypothetical protein
VHGRKINAKWPGGGLSSLPVATEIHKHNIGSDSLSAQQDAPTTNLSHWCLGRFLCSRACRQEKRVLHVYVSDAETLPAFGKVKYFREYLKLQPMELATCENTVLDLEPISQGVPTTIIRIIATITAFSILERE